MEKLEMFTQALRIRRIEEAIAAAYGDQEIRCPVHLSIGQEINAVAIADCIKKTDYMVSTHRGHAHYLAKGGPLLGLIGELYGRTVGCSRGFGGSMHLTDLDAGFIASTSIVAGTIPIGLGAAFTSMVKKEDKISVICIGDAATEEGTFHESANFAGLHSLPVIFFMENNNYSCFTPRYRRQPERNGGFETMAKSHGLLYFRISASNFYRDYLFLKQAIEEMREDGDVLPIFVECDAYRFVEHCGPNDDDHLGYRPKDEVKAALDNDIIEKLKEELQIPKKIMQEIEQEIAREIGCAFLAAKLADASPWVKEYTYA